MLPQNLTCRVGLHLQQRADRALSESRSRMAQEARDRVFGSPAALVGPCNSNPQYYYHEEDGATAQKPGIYFSEHYLTYLF